MSAAAGLPIVEELEELASEEVFRRLASRPHCIFFDSARQDPRLGRYSFVSADPFAWLCFRPTEAGALNALNDRLAEFRAPPVPGLPPFQGGAAGLLSYDLGRQIERVPAPRYDEFQVPALAVGLYDTVAAFDHRDGRAWIISQGFPECDPRRRAGRARARLREFREWLRQERPDGSTTPSEKVSPLHLDQLAPQFKTDRARGVTSNFSPADYLNTVARAIEYVRAGDIFQVNLSQRLLHPAVDSAVALYFRLRQRNPAPFAGYFDLGEFQIASASPERFLQTRDGLVEARPIKGTRQRTAWPEADLFSGDELQQNAKDRAENIMIVDLLRNDLSRVCRPESVQVSDLCRLETYQFVQHLVSVVVGRLRPELGAIDLLRAAFPGGSITGAPKPRAMEIIAELEPTARGAYCGCLAYIGFDGSMDSSILIRTITAGRGWWQAPVGGGIIARSQPAGEYEETWHKAEGLLRALA